MTIHQDFAPTLIDLKADLKLVNYVAGDCLEKKLKIALYEKGWEAIFTFDYLIFRPL